MQLRTNQLVEVTILDDTPARPLRTHVLRADDERVVLALPLARHRWVVPLPGTPVRVVFRDPEDQSGDRGLYAFTSTVLQASVSPEPELHLAAPAKVERVQRRRWVRLQINLPVWLTRSGDGPVIEARTTDVSGGGIRVRSSQPLQRGERLTVQMAFPGGWAVRATGQVVRTGDGDANEYGIVFVDIDWRLQDRITGFILAEQARRRRLLG